MRRILRDQPGPMRGDLAGHEAAAPRGPAVGAGDDLHLGPVGARGARALVRHEPDHERAADVAHLRRDRLRGSARRVHPPALPPAPPVVVRPHVVDREPPDLCVLKYSAFFSGLVLVNAFYYSMGAGAVLCYKVRRGTLT